MERWALDALENHMQEQGDSRLKEIASLDEKRTLMMRNGLVVLKEWLPEADQDDPRLEIAEPDTLRLRPQLNEKQKQRIDFDYIFCIGGDGTLLRLLRILFFKFLPPTLPKIVTFSMGSLGYLCNFEIAELNKVLDATVLSNT